MLRPAGFRRRGSRFLRDVGDVVHLVQLQSSTQSTAAALRMTANLGVFSPVVDRALGGTIAEPTEPDCHWRERLGFLTPANSDVWWTVRESKNAAAVADELKRDLAQGGLPTLDRLASTQALRVLWESGAAPGLIDYERKRYLAALATRASDTIAPVT